METEMLAQIALQNFYGVINPLPKKVAAVGSAFEQMSYVETPDPWFDADKATTDNVAALVDKLAQQISVKNAYAEAVRTAKKQLAYKVLQACAEAAPDLLAHLQKGVDTTSAVFVDAYLQLPADKSPANLLRLQNGSDLYATVLEAQAVLKNAQQFAVSLFQLPVYGGVSPQPQLAILNCKSRAEFQKVMSARTDDSGIDAEFGVAAELGLEWKLLDPRQADELATKLNSEPAVSLFPGTTRMVRGADGIDRLVKSDGVTPVGA